MVSFDDNPMAEPNFAFYDVRLKELVEAGDEQALEFFRCLALCHTVMPDEKAGQCGSQGVTYTEICTVHVDHHFQIPTHTHGSYFNTFVLPTCTCTLAYSHSNVLGSRRLCTQTYSNLLFSYSAALILCRCGVLLLVLNVLILGDAVCRSADLPGAVAGRGRAGVGRQELRLRLQGKLSVSTQQVLLCGLCVGINRKLFSC